MYPLYSLDLTISDFYLFHSLQKVLNKIKKMLKIFLNTGIFQLLKKMVKDHSGKYVTD